MGMISSNDCTCEWELFKPQKPLKTVYTKSTSSDASDTDDFQDDLNENSNSEINTFTAINANQTDNHNSKMIKSSSKVIKTTITEKHQYLNYIQTQNQQQELESNTTTPKKKNKSNKKKKKKTKKKKDKRKKSKSPRNKKSKSPRNEESDNFNYRKSEQISANKQKHTSDMAGFLFVINDDEEEGSSNEYTQQTEYTQNESTQNDDDDGNDDESDNQTIKIHNVDQFGDGEYDDENDNNEDNLSQCSTTATKPYHPTSFEDEIDNNEGKFNDNNIIKNNNNNSNNSNAQSNSSLSYSHTRIPSGLTVLLTNDSSIDSDNYHNNNNNNNNNRKSVTWSTPKSTPVPTVHEIHSNTVLPMLYGSNSERRPLLINQSQSVKLNYNINPLQSGIFDNDYDDDKLASFSAPHSPSLTLGSLPINKPSSTRMFTTRNNINKSSAPFHFTSKSLSTPMDFNKLDFHKYGKVQNKDSNNNNITKHNKHNWSIDRIDCQQEAMQKELLFLKQFENSRSNWISREDNNSD